MSCVHVCHRMVDTHCLCMLPVWERHSFSVFNAREINMYAKPAFLPLKSTLFRSSHLLVRAGLFSMNLCMNFVTGHPWVSVFLTTGELQGRCPTCLTASAHRQGRSWGHRSPPSERVNAGVTE